MSQEAKAINVIGESADVYYNNYQNLSDDLRKRLSLEMLDNIYKKMVIPAIEHARKLDREK